MSRIGKRPIEIPSGVEFKLDNGVVKVKGPKGNLELAHHSAVKLVQEGSTVTVQPIDDTKANRRFHGLTRSLVANMVEGVSKGFEKRLTLIGTGYRAAAKGAGITLSLGYSHPIDFDAPQGINLAVDKLTTVIVTGADKQLVGEVAAKIRGFRPPEPYHGKGVRYADEHVATKVGKSAGK
jgi:large subunit ribosomal protein L6